MTIVPDILGEPEIYEVPDPAPGNQVNHTVSKSGRWLINHITFRFNTAANLGTRYTKLWFNQSGIDFAYTALMFTPISDSVTVYHTAAHGYPTDYASKPEYAFLPLPRILQFSGTFTLKIDAFGMFPGDAFSRVKIFASFWHEH
jgi:hypothetical protein